MKMDSKRKHLLPCASLVLVLLLLTPTIISVVNILSPDSVAKIAIANAEEEEREEERSAGEDEVEEFKQLTLPYEMAHKDDFGSLAVRQHFYQLGDYSSDLLVPYLPPELIA